LQLTFAANANLVISRSLGVKSGFEGDDSNPPAELQAAEAEQAVLGFSIDVALSDGDVDPRTARRPLIGGVLVEANQFDPRASSVLVVRCSGAGLSSKVATPTKMDERTMQFEITRMNKPDVAEWIHANNPRVTEAELVQYRKDSSDLLMNKFGNHMGYEVLNTAFRALVPNVEGWTVTVQVMPPYMFGEIDNAVIFCDKSQIDILAALPLIKETPSVDKMPAVLMAKSVN
jgi:hypothetical protein